MKEKENPRGGVAERVRKDIRLANVIFDGQVKVKVYYSRGHGSRKGTGENVEVTATSYPLYMAVLDAVRKERRRRRHTGGEAFEFRISLREG